MYLNSSAFIYITYIYEVLCWIFLYIWTHFCFLGHLMFQNCYLSLTKCDQQIVLPQANVTSILEKGENRCLQSFSHISDFGTWACSLCYDYVSALYNHASSVHAGSVYPWSVSFVNLTCCCPIPAGYGSLLRFISSAHVLLRAIVISVHLDNYIYVYILLFLLFEMKLLCYW